MKEQILKILRANIPTIVSEEKIQAMAIEISAIAEQYEQDAYAEGYEQGIRDESGD